MGADFEQIGLEAVLKDGGFFDDMETYNKTVQKGIENTDEFVDSTSVIPDTMGDMADVVSESSDAIAGMTQETAGLGEDVVKTGGRLIGMNSTMTDILATAVALAPGIIAIGGALVVAGLAAVDFIKDTKQLGDLSLELQIPIEKLGEFNELSLRTGVSMNTLKQMMISMQSQGYEPTIEDLTSLVIKYQQLPPGIERVKFAQEKFGTSTAEVQRLLSKNPAIFQESSRAAKASAAQYSEAALQMAEAMENAQQRIKATWKDFWSGFGQGISTSFFASLFPKSEAGIAANYMIMLQNIQNMQANIGAKIHTQSGAVITVTQEMIDKAVEEADVFAKQNGLLSTQEYLLSQNTTELGKTKTEAEELLAIYQAQQKAAVEFGISGAFTKAIEDYRTNLKSTQDEIVKTEGTIKWMEGMVANAPKVIKDLQDAMALEKLEVSDQSQRYEDLNNELDKWLNIQNNGPQFIENWNGKISDTKQKQLELEQQLRQTTAQMILQQISSSLTAEAQLEYARATGLMNEADYNLAKTAQGLVNVFDTNHDGIVSGTEDVKGYTDALITLGTTAQDVATSAEGAKTMYYTSTGQAVDEIKAKTDQAILDAATAKMKLKTANQEVFDALKEQAGDTESILSDKNFWSDVGKGVTDGIIKGMQDNESAVWDATKALAQNMEDVLREEWGIKSPSKVFAKIGKEVILGLVGGINNQESKAVASMSHVAQALSATAAGSLANIPTTTSMMIPEVPRASSQATAPVAENASTGANESIINNTQNNVTTQGATAQEVVQQINNAQLLQSYQKTSSPILKPTTGKIFGTTV